ncbi:ribosomal protein S18-alanine N-acetyltransferase [Chitinibacter fontanus]|uniref:Ribosomal protein S18-alanine N-acetyltransferase n=1 Tax=Chitinibacter fontanus TaxID=1737446 RepID=A0A7D5Z0Q5_9NEIS|nr:ribosomal protein S18-alanine N-acetyltransferase [Chitinibacter fontanus]QLI80461.1 ribosomal protein S18-alanine N-acetyltransferase [Chitinibacter fontanus]
MNCTSNTRPAPLLPKFARLDASHVAALADLDESTNAHPWTGKQWLDSLQQHDCFGLWNNGQLAGFIVCMATLDEAEVLLLAITPTLQSHGLGAQLLHYAETTLAREGIRQLFLEVRRSNTGARSFYARHGWQEAGCRKNYYPCDIETDAGEHITREDAILCSKQLTHPANNGAQP